MFWDEEGIERPDPTGRDAEIRQAFVKEYMYDRNPVRAAMRLGLTGQFAQSWSDKFMLEPYVLRLIKEEEKSFADKINNRDPEVLSRIINSLFNESQTAVKCATRVAALSKLVNMTGLDNSVITDDEPQGQIVIKVTPGRNTVVNNGNQ